MIFNPVIALASGGEGAINEVPPEQFLASETAFVIIEYNGYSYLASHKTLGTDIVYANGGIIFTVDVEVDAFGVSLMDIESVGEVYAGHFSNGNYSETAYYGSSAHFYDFI